MLEHRLANQLEAMIGGFNEEERTRARGWAAQSTAMADEVARMSGGAVVTVDDLDVAATAERLVDDYLDLADLSRDEDLTTQAQSLAKRAIEVKPQYGDRNTMEY